MSAAVMGSRGQSDTGGVLACIEGSSSSNSSSGKVSVSDVGHAVTKIRGSAEMSVLHLQEREHFREVEQRDRGMLTW
jgi:hypothetical protein